jgi:uncharacterized protein YndB with AHSA1/START domain
VKQGTKKSTSLTIRRTYLAAADRIYRAFTDVKDLERWYAPQGLTAVVDEFSPRVGGAFEITMGNDESSYTCYGTFVELIPFSRIVHTWQWKGEEWDEPTLVTVEIRPAEGVAEVVLSHERFKDGEEANEHCEGWVESLDKLAKLLEEA